MPSATEHSQQLTGPIRKLPSDGSKGTDQDGRPTSRTESTKFKKCPAQVGGGTAQDLKTRQISIREALVDSKLWWEGPHWLSKDESCWPSEEQQLNEEDEFKIGTERKRKVTMAATLITERPLKFDWDLGKIGSWQKLVRRTAWMSRWQGKRPPDDIDGRDRIVMQHVDANGEFTGEISEHQVRSLRGEEIRAAELKLIRMLQRENFPDAFYALSNDRQLQKKAKLRQLQPVWDPRDELIRVQGRMELAIREAKANPPVLLPANHPVMDLLTAHCSLLTRLKERQHRP